MNFGFSASYVALWGLVLFQGLLVLAVLRQLAELHLLMDQGVLPDESSLPTGSQAPEFTIQDMQSGNFVSSSLFDGRGGVILFLSPGCTVCKALAESFRSSPVSDSGLIVAICSGEEHPCTGFRAGLGGNVRLLLDRDNEVGARYRIAGFPTAVVVDNGQRIRAYAHPRSATDLEQLLGRSLDNVVAEDTSRQPSIESHTKFSLTPGASYDSR